MVGCCWIELPKGKYKVREEKSEGQTNSQYPGKVRTRLCHTFISKGDVKEYITIPIAILQLRGNLFLSL